MDWSKFFSMGGYAFYVWGSYLTALVIIGAEVLFLARKRKALAETDAALKQEGSLNK